MAITLPGPIAAYFLATNAHDIDAALAPFAESAMVKDEGRQRRGTAAIRDWIEETMRKYRHTVEVIAVESAGGKSIVTGRVAGNFPGSPVVLRHEFTLAGDEISRLHIHA